MSSADNGDESFALEMLVAATRPIGHSTSDHDGYSGEDWNDELVDGRRSKEQLSRLLDNGYQSEYDNLDEDILTPSDSDDDVGNI